jgi:hypothetical protein
MSFRHKNQAVVLFIVAPIGMLGAYVVGAEGLDGKPNVWQGGLMAVIAIGAVALGVWLWRRP